MVACELIDYTSDKLKQQPPGLPGFTEKKTRQDFDEIGSQDRIISVVERFDLISTDHRLMVTEKSHQELILCVAL